MAATNTIEPAMNDMAGIPTSNLNALRRVTDASRIAEKTLTRVEATRQDRRTAKERTQLLTALRLFTAQLTAARHSIASAHTQQGRAQGYIDAQNAATQVNKAQTAVFTACPTNG